MSGLTPTATVSRAVSTNMAASPAPSPASVLAAARRPVNWPAKNSSHRPAASSPRRYLVAVSNPQIDAISIVTPSALQSVNPPIVVIRCVWPSNALSPVLVPMAESSASRLAVVDAIDENANALS